MEKPLIMIADDAMFVRRVIKRALTQGGVRQLCGSGRRRGSGGEI